MKSKSVAAIAIAFFIGVGSVTSVNAATNSVGDPGRSWAIPNDGERGQHVQEFLDTQPGELTSFLIQNNVYSKYNDENPTCSSLADTKCASGNIAYQAALPFCKDGTEVNCTSDFGTIDSAGKKTSAVFSRYFPLKAQNEYVGDSRYKLPSGVAKSLYTIPQAPHDGGDTYLLSVLLQGGGNSLDSISLADFNVRIYPIKLESLNYSCGGICNDSGYSKLPKDIAGNPTGKDTWLSQGPGFQGNSFCVADSTKEGLCAQRYAFPADIRYYVTVKLQQIPSGWMHGRMSDPNIQITKENGYSTIEIAANPVAVPAIYKMYNYPQMPVELKSQYDVKTGAYINSDRFKYDPNNAAPGGRTEANDDPLRRNIINAVDSSAPWGMDELKLWLPFLNDQATSVLSYWSARTLSTTEREGSNACFTDKENVTGIVTTNSTQYSAGPPTFNKTEGTLEYKVGAPHSATDKSVFKGSYDLVMRSDVARCVYGFSKAPINATIAITSADGTPQVATTVMGEKNGWVYLQAKNFEFSTPVIKAKLTQEPEPTPAPTVTPTPTPTPSVTAKATAKKNTISCIKGKVTKKVTGVNPKCPNGYKKKG